jgi:hypothetical protein
MYAFKVHSRNANLAWKRDTKRAIFHLDRLAESSGEKTALGFTVHSLKREQCRKYKKMQKKN